ncbi:MAG: glycosyltransferase [Prolixibacteraceae bacterium]|nr:glycosyltransferase [Prolixibacteraceae bacterium]
MDKLPKISVITVVFNDADNVEGTIKSVVNQNYPDIEYIVIDGASTDGTKEIIEKYSDRISFWLSEPDTGLYNAMNKGIEKASGHYVLFLNSGDKLHNPEILQTIFAQLNGQLPDVVFGETMIVAEDESEIGLRRLKAPEILTWKSLRDGMLVCHQSFLASRELAPEYDEMYRFAADYDWMLKILKKADSIHNSQLIIASFLDGGVSKKNIRKGLRERFSIMVNNYGFFPTLFRHFVIGFRFFSFLVKYKRF